MDKCEWKDGKFEGCSPMGCQLNRDGWKFNYYEDDNMTAICAHDYVYFFCPFCGANIRKPELEKPLIVKSGGTYVAYWKGIDYLWTGKEGKIKIELTIGCIPVLCSEAFSGRVAPGWKSFTGENPDITELTDELALLRPMVGATVKVSQFMYILWGVKNGYGIFEHDDSVLWICTDNCRLATAHELQGAE